MHDYQRSVLLLTLNLLLLCCSEISFGSAHQERSSSRSKYLKISPTAVTSDPDTDSGSMTRSILFNKRNFSSTLTSNSRQAVVAVGSNLGNRFQNIARAIELLCDPSFDETGYKPTRLKRTSFLHETAPMYISEQPAFLNGAVQLDTDFSPRSLLKRIKKVEGQLGRDFSALRNGPRPVDLDILFYDRPVHAQNESTTTPTTSLEPTILDSPDLTVPHIRIEEREFVLQPLCEVIGSDYEHPVLNETIGSLLQSLRSMEKDAINAIRVLPLPRDRVIRFNETVIMGILNVTPDSFSDGGKWTSSVESAASRALQMEKEGAGIIDIGGESTRPGAKEVSVEEQIQRVCPVITEIRRLSDVPISIDTRHAKVAKKAIEAGADIVNDVSGGSFDSEMLTTVARLKVPLILMHMRGTPETMMTLTRYQDLLESVTSTLQRCVENAKMAGIPSWQLVIDPGIGFAKNEEGNLRLLKHIGFIRDSLGGLPVLIGTSRKGFLGSLTGETVAKERDYATVSSCVTALCLDKTTQPCDILRVHNVKAAKQASLIMDAIRRQ